MKITLTASRLMWFVYPVAILLLLSAITVYIGSTTDWSYPRIDPKNTYIHLKNIKLNNDTLILNISSTHKVSYDLIMYIENKEIRYPLNELNSSIRIPMNYLEKIYEKGYLIIYIEGVIQAGDFPLTFNSTRINVTASLRDIILSGEWRNNIFCVIIENPNPIYINSTVEVYQYITEPFTSLYNYSVYNLALRSGFNELCLPRGEDVGSVIVRLKYDDSLISEVFESG